MGCCSCPDMQGMFRCRAPVGARMPLAHAGDGSNGEHSSDGTCAENSAHSTGENVFSGGLEVGLDAARGSFAVPPVVRLLPVCLCDTLARTLSALLCAVAGPAGVLALDLCSKRG